MTHLGELVAALVDGELSHDARDRALAHLTGCDSCRRAVEEERRTKAVLRGLRDPAVPLSLEFALTTLPDEHTFAATTGALRSGRPLRRRGRGAGTAPQDHRPRGRARARRVSVAAGSTVALGACLAFALGGGPASDRPVTPQLTQFGVEHAAVTPEVPLEDQAGTAVVVSYATTYRP